MDGTIIDSIAAVEHAWRHWAALEGIDPPSAEDFHGRTAADLVSALLPPERFLTALDTLTELERQPSVPIPMLPGALALIRSLPTDRWAIVTSATLPVARARLEHSGLPLPTLLITADAVTRGKPDPQPYQKGARWKSEVQPAVAFEDTVAGLRSAKAAGCRTVGVVGTHSFVELQPHADAVVESLADVSVFSNDDNVLHVQILALG
jgi:sugar-phosphatase